jgi:hypothetical protein
MTIRSILGGAALALLAGVAPAAASLIHVSSYDMPNGNGIPSSGFKQYWDGTYVGTSPAGNSTTPNAALFGGTGALTDGIIANMRWDNDINTNFTGTGKYVGWDTRPVLSGGLGGDPLITFHFDGSQTINEINIWADDSKNGHVGGPIGVLVNGVATLMTTSGVDPECPTPNNNTAACAVKLTLLGNWTGELITIQPIHNPVGILPWMMISEVQFANAVPEPSTWAMMLLGFAGIAYMTWRRSRKTSPAVAAA